jgi:amino acid permease
MLPRTSIVVAIIKLFFIVNNVCTYPIHIKACNTNIDKVLTKGMDKSLKRTWIKNMSRFTVLVSSVIVAVMVADKLDKFLGFIGAVVCPPLALFMPALLHYTVVSESRIGKTCDIILILLSIATLIYCVIDLF